MTARRTATTDDGVVKDESICNQLDHLLQSCAVYQKLRSANFEESDEDDMSVLALVLEIMNTGQIVKDAVHACDSLRHVRFLYNCA